MKSQASLLLLQAALHPPRVGCAKVGAVVLSRTRGVEQLEPSIHEGQWKSSDGELALSWQVIMGDWVVIGW